ncbi:phage tail protein [Salmonella enterica subsp. enterica serovar Newport]|nr:phage tail protein [Salmonella enterica subsp. enterica serovar Newport]EEH9026711.1 phage tail protein [Salmonella enterica subsp. enterica serovar Newport]
MDEVGNLFDRAMRDADDTIIELMGTEAQIISGGGAGKILRGVFDETENIDYAGMGVRVEGSCPSLFVKTTLASSLRRYDALVINHESFWVDRISPDDGGCCYIWLGRGEPPTSIRHG